MAVGVALEALGAAVERLGQLGRLRRARLRQARAEAPRPELAREELEPVDRARRSPAPPRRPAAPISTSRSTSPPIAIRVARLRSRVALRAQVQLLGALGRLEPCEVGAEGGERRLARRGRVRRQLAVERVGAGAGAVVLLEVSQLALCRGQLGARLLVAARRASSASRSSTPACVTESLAARALTADALWLCRPSSRTPNVISETTAVRAAAASTRRRRPQGRRTGPLYGPVARAGWRPQISRGLPVPAATGRIAPSRPPRPNYPAAAKKPPTPSVSSPSRRTCWAPPTPTVTCAGSTPRGSAPRAGRRRSSTSARTWTSCTRRTAAR